MSVDSFKFLPRIISFYYQKIDKEPELPIPWTPLLKPLGISKFGLVTSAGIYHRFKGQSFDLPREVREPTWGDPTFRTLPMDIQQEEISVSHLHINTADIYKDVNIILPIHLFKTLFQEGKIGGLANSAYSFMGFQGFPPDTSAWENIYGLLVVDQLLAENVDCVFLTPA
jgi:D-proline reductase (dithiol) PrdB